MPNGGRIASAKGEFEDVASASHRTSGSVVGVASETAPEAQTVNKTGGQSSSSKEQGATRE